MTVHTLMSPGGATEAKQVDIITVLGQLLTELGQKLEAGQAVALDAPTLAALENVTAIISNFPTDYPDADLLAKMEQVRVLLEGVLEVSGNVEVSNFPDTQMDGLTDAQLRAADVNVADSGEREYTHVVATVTASGSTVVHTPAAGKRVRLRWIYAINEPTSDTAPLIRVLLGAEEKYRLWAISKRQKVTGPVDGALVVNLSAGGNVAVTALLEEV